MRDIYYYLRYQILGDECQQLKDLRVCPNVLLALTVEDIRVTFDAFYSLKGKK